MTPSPLQLVPGRLVALGATFPLDGRVSWYPPSWRGHAPANAYLLLEEDAALLLDTGLTVHRDIVLEQLAGSLGGRPLSILHTRVVELDGACNTGSVIRRERVERLYANQPAQLFARLHGDADEEPRGAPAVATPPAQMIADGDTLSIGTTDSGRDRLAVVAPALRLLATSWIHDRATRTLFTSDSFIHAVAPIPGGPAVAAADTALPSVERVATCMHAKLDWLDDADTAPIRERLAAQLATLEIERIAPQYGLVLEGADVVAAQIGRVLDAIGHQPAAEASR